MFNLYDKDILPKIAGISLVLIIWIIINTFLKDPCRIPLFILCPKCEQVPYKYNKNYHNNQVNLKVNVSMRYPDCWNRDDSEDTYGTIVKFISPDGDQKAKLIINVDEYSGNLDNYQKQEIEYVTEHLDKSKIMEELDTVVANKPGKKIIVTGEDEIVNAENKNEKIKIKNMYLLTLRGTTAYQITYTVPENDYDKFLPTIEEMIKSLDIADE